LVAEKACHQAVVGGNLTCFCFRISRCFPESENLMALYRLYRGVDILDVIQAHKLALSSNLTGCEIMNISCKTPFKEDEVEELYSCADTVIERHFSGIKKTFLDRGWDLPKSIDRVYVTEKASRLLEYQPNHNFLEFIEKSKKMAHLSS